jgi:aminopeptidase N
MDKWLAIQASSRLPGTLDRVKGLMTHPVFNIKNPNKVRALIGAFASIAARLVSVFTLWKRYDEKRQALMKKELERIVNTPKLSKDVYEVVSKSLV